MWMFRPGSSARRNPVLLRNKSVFLGRVDGAVLTIPPFAKNAKDGAPVD
jgi:hypothetical protein